ncbi:hypothetical protein [Crassaminicella profunda]|uniref:hypothetical protein n=1 Tax=Crassaminicella profunda TaxID=1286698 RepID=UPI001CA670A3|nr:hypothetical protein [Crassaminicella profunda]QZY55414.1 hypothetical protein K7H06_20860 [Crassaminicella profunda]
MCIRIVSLSITPKEVLELLMGEIDGDLIHYEYHQIKENIGFGNAVFEKFYTRMKSQRMMIVSMENIENITNATIILSSNHEEDTYRLDFEIEDECMEEILEILDGYIIDEKIE